MPHPRAPHSEDSYEAQGSSALTRFLSGLMAFSGGVFICGACSSYNSADSSLNMAVSRTQDPVTNAIIEAAPENMFGSVGAVFGDMLMQGFGWTAILLGFALMIGGVRRAFGIGQRDPAAWMWGLAAILFAACCLAEWPIPKSWNMSAGLGGVMGELMLAVISTPFAALKIPDPQVWASALAGLGAILFAAMAMGLGASDASSLWRALTQKPQRAPEAAIVGVPALASRPAASGSLMDNVMRLLGKKPEEVIEPIVYTEEDGFEEGDRGFFTAVERPKALMAAHGPSCRAFSKAARSRTPPQPPSPSRRRQSRRARSQTAATAQRQPDDAGTGSRA